MALKMMSKTVDGGLNVNSLHIRKQGLTVLYALSARV
jgi:hypothetical protein